MKNANILSTILFLSIAILCLNTVVSAQEQQEVIGRVIKTSGTVQARALNGDLRPLSRRSDIYLKDTIITSSDGFAQVRLIDQGMVAFLAETEFTFEEYSYDGPGGKADNAIMTMVRGGFRTISGNIGDDDQDDYEVKTPFASIGIRGTTHEALIVDGVLFTGVYDGGTTIYNDEGSINTGIGANFDFTQTIFGESPQGLLQQPAALGQANFAVAAPAADSEEAEDPLGNEVAGTTPAPEFTLANTNNTVAATLGRSIDSAINPSENLRPDDVDRGTVLSPEELSSLTNNSFLVGSSLSNNLSGMGARDSAPLFRESPNNLIITTQPDANITVSQQQTFSNFNVSWERWEGSLASFTDNNQPDVWNPVVDNVNLFSTFNIASNTNQRGHFSNVLGWIGEDESGTGINAQTSSLNFDVDFTSGSVSNGELNLYINHLNSSEQWSVLFDGSVENNYAIFNIVDSRSELMSQLQYTNTSGGTSSSAVAGNFLGAFINQGEEFLGSFNFNSTQALGESGAEQIQRIFGQVLVGGDIENRFSLSEENQLTGSGLALPVGLNADIFQVASEAGIDNNNPLLVQTSGYPATRVFKKGDADVVGFESLVGDDLYGLSWGIFWANGPHALLDPINSDDPQNIESYDKLLWLTVNDPFITTFTGSTSFNVAGNFLGTSNAGSVTGVQSAFDINFATGSITDGFITICVNGNGCNNAITWQASFANSNSSISNGYLQATGLTGTMSDTNNNLSTITDSHFTALFTSADPSNTTSVAPSAAAVGLNFSTASNDFVSVAYLAEHESRVDAAQLNSMRNNIALIVEAGPDGSVFFGSATDTTNPVIGVNPGRSFNNPSLLRQDFAQVRSASSASQTATPSSSFDLGWGLWDQANIVQQTDADNASTTLTATTDQLWAVMSPSNIADLTGQWSYGGTSLPVIGSSTDGAITQLDMSFNVNFNTGAISNGTFSANTGPSSWAATYTGNVSGAVAKMNNITGIYTNPSAVSTSLSNADIGGVFVGTGATQGFAAGFTLTSGSDHIEGLGLLEGVETE